MNDQNEDFIEPFSLGSDDLQEPVMFQFSEGETFQEFGVQKKSDPKKETFLQTFNPSNPDAQTPEMGIIQDRQQIRNYLAPYSDHSYSEQTNQKQSKFLQKNKAANNDHQKQYFTNSRDLRNLANLSISNEKSQQSELSAQQNVFKNNAQLPKLQLPQVEAKFGNKQQNQKQSLDFKSSREFSQQLKQKVQIHQQVNMSAQYGELDGREMQSSQSSRVVQSSHQYFNSSIIQKQQNAQTFQTATKLAGTNKKSGNSRQSSGRNIGSQLQVWQTEKSMGQRSRNNQSSTIVQHQNSMPVFTTYDPNSNVQILTQQQVAQIVQMNSGGDRQRVNSQVKKSSSKQSIKQHGNGLNFNQQQIKILSNGQSSQISQRGQSSHRSQNAMMSNQYPTKSYANQAHQANNAANQQHIASQNSIKRGTGSKNTSLRKETRDSIKTTIHKRDTIQNINTFNIRDEQYQISQSPQTASNDNYQINAKFVQGKNTYSSGNLIKVQNIQQLPPHSAGGIAPEQMMGLGPRQSHSLSRNPHLSDMEQKAGYKSQQQLTYRQQLHQRNMQGAYLNQRQIDQMNQLQNRIVGIKNNRVQNEFTKIYGDSKPLGPANGLYVSNSSKGINNKMRSLNQSPQIQQLIQNPQQHRASPVIGKVHKFDQGIGQPQVPGQTPIIQAKNIINGSKVQMSRPKSSSRMSRGQTNLQSKQVQNHQYFQSRNGQQTNNRKTTAIAGKQLNFQKQY